jgi:copper homeostasis protein
MLQDVKLAKDLSCDGVVIGLLQGDGTIDIKRTNQLIEAASPLGVTFHRAFDRCKDPLQAVEQLIALGCERILTSGQQPTVTEGLAMLIQLNQTANNRIIIMPGSGLRADNIKTLAEQTGCTEFHSSLRAKEKSKMDFMHPAFANSAESYMNNSIDANEVRKLRNALG